MGTTNILDLNNRVDELAKSYPADKVMMSDGGTSVEDAVDEKSKILTTEVSFTVNSSAQLVISRSLNIPYAKIIALTQKYNDDTYNMVAGYHIVGYRLMLADNNGIGEAILLGPSGGWSALSSAQATIIAKIAYIE